MAATIAKATGYDRTRDKAVHRLGHEASSAQANTWRTFTHCYIRKDGSGQVSVDRDGQRIHFFEFGPES